MSKFVLYFELLKNTKLRIFKTNMSIICLVFLEIFDVFPYTSGNYWKNLKNLSNKVWYFKSDIICYQKVTHVKIS